MNSFRFALARRRNTLHYARESKRPEGLTSGRIDDLSITELLFVLQMHVNTVFQVSTHFIGKLDFSSSRLPVDSAENCTCMLTYCNDLESHL